MSMPLGSRRPRDGVRPGERCAAAAPRRAGDGHLRVRPLVEDADGAPDAPDLLETVCRRPSRADDGRLRACESWRKTLKTSRTHATYSSMSTDGRRVRRSRSSRSARPTSTQRTLYGCRSPAGRTEGRYDRRARHVNRAALDVRVDHDACGVHASRGRDARVEGARVCIMSSSEQAGDAPTIVSHGSHFSTRTSFVGCSGRPAKILPSKLAWSALETGVRSALTLWAALSRFALTLPSPETPPSPKRGETDGLATR